MRAATSHGDEGESVDCALVLDDLDEEEGEDGKDEQISGQVVCS